jgi:hypothetical protein
VNEFLNLTFVSISIDAVSLVLTMFIVNCMRYIDVDGKGKKLVFKQNTK